MAVFEKSVLRGLKIPVAVDCPDCGYHGFHIEAEGTYESVYLNVVATCVGCGQRYQMEACIGEMNRLDKGRNSDQGG